MKTAVFVNFSAEPFIGFWNGRSVGPSVIEDPNEANPNKRKKKGFRPGESLAMPDYLAKHFAKHLANRELLKMAKTDPVYERFTSPKRPEDVPQFMELFNRACVIDEDVDEKEGKDELDVQIEVIAKNRASKTEKGTEDDVHVLNDFPDDEDDELGANNGAPAVPKA